MFQVHVKNSPRQFHTGMTEKISQIANIQSKSILTFLGNLDQGTLKMQWKLTKALFQAPPREGIFDLWKLALWLQGAKIYYSIQSKAIQMSKQPQEPFIICRNEQSSPSFDFLPAIKSRKPTKHSWSPAQSFHYVTFLKENLEAMESKEQRKNLKVFSLMAKIIKTRTSTQVKSHHQKLQRKYGKITTIIGKVSQFLSRELHVSKKDAETSIEIKLEPEEKQVMSYCSPTLQILEQDDWRRSQCQLVFFEEESDNNYLTFEGNRIFEDEEPLI